MSATLFSPAAARRDLPLRDRANIPAGGFVFGPDMDGFAVHVTPEARLDLRLGTAAAVPSEAFGLLVGRAFADHRGPFTLVVGVVYAEQAECEAGPGYVRLRGDAVNAVRERAEARFPGLDLVGWTHSHESPAFDRYSSTDHAEQRTWPHDYHVGVLTFMHAWDEARAFRGPESVPLPLAAPAPRAAPQRYIPTARPTLPPGPMFAPAPVGGRPAPHALTERGIVSTPPARTWAAPPPAPPAGRLTAAMVISSAVIIIALCIGGAIWIGRQVVEATLALRAMAHPAVARPESVAWSCASDPRTAGRIECVAPLGEGISGWLWAFGDGASAGAPNVDHTYTHPGVYQVQLILRTPTGTVDAGTRDLVIAPPRAAKE